MQYGASWSAGREGLVDTTELTVLYNAAIVLSFRCSVRVIRPMYDSSGSPASISFLVNDVDLHKRQRLACCMLRPLCSYTMSNIHVVMDGDPCDDNCTERLP